MAINFFLQDKLLLVKFSGRVNDFSQIIALLKLNKCIYNPDSKEWSVPPKNYYNICDAISDTEVIEIAPEVEGFVNAKSQITSEIRKYRSSLEKSDLKVPPFKGKPPFEDFQYDDILKLISRNRFALFNEQGTGKSYELISALDYYRKQQKISKILVITSNSGVYNFKKEFEKFSNFDMSRIAIAGVKNREPFKENIDVVICNYRSFLLISDHAHYQANPDKKSKNKLDQEFTGGGPVVRR